MSDFKSNAVAGPANPPTTINNNDLQLFSTVSTKDVGQDYLIVLLDRF